MKRIMYIAIALLMACNCNAQIERSAKSVFSLTTFKKDGSILASSHGVFVGSDGEAISIWSPFIGADHATVIDALGNEMEVTSIIQANELYDVCKFQVSGKTKPAPIASIPAAKGEKIWIIGYSNKSPQVDQRNIQRTETFMDKYTYYIFSSNIPDNSEGCPFVNSKGEVLGLLQHSKTNEDIYATDARYMNDFKVKNGLYINEPALKQTAIPVAFPEDHDQASVMLTLAHDQGDSLKYVKYINAFLKKYPTAIEGYNAQAENQINANDFAGAATTMETAISKATKKDEAHSAYSRLIFQKEIYKSQMPYASWNLDKALEEAKEAYKANPLPIYQHQQAQIVFAKADYNTAYDMFMSLTKTPLRNGELFYEAAQCKTQLKAPHKDIMELLDSAIAASPQPLNQIGAPYVLARGTEYFNAGEYKNSVIDFNRYDSLMNGRPISSEFYYTREKAEMQIHQYQQALNDINRSILLSRDQPTLWAEKASIHLRFNQLDDAIKSATICTQIAPEYADGYILLGVAHMTNKNKVEGEKALLKAKELGDARADEYLKKYK
jgi:tetratricopeptide (TPR) repeat protein